MALKKVAAASKQAKKAPAAKAPVAKRGPKAKVLDEEVVATQTPTKKGKKQPIPQAEPSDEESDASEEENGVNFEDGSDSEGEEEGGNGLVDSQAEEDDEEDDDDDDEDEGNVTKPVVASDDDESESDENEQDDDDEEDDEEEPGEVKPRQAADSDDDEAPEEEPIAKKEKKGAKKIKEEAIEEDQSDDKKVGIPKIQISRIPSDTPKDQIIFISNFPPEYKHGELVALFAKFGPISVINRVNNKAGGINVKIAFETAESAAAALAAKPKAVTLNGNVLSVSRILTKDDLRACTVSVGLIGTKTTRAHLEEHFAKCGEIDAINFSKNRANPTAFVVFKSKESVAEAVKLHSTECNGRFVTVRDEQYKKNPLKSQECTITILNENNHESYSSDAVEKIFKKYGEIVDVDLICSRLTFGFVTFKEPQQAEKALSALNDKVVGDLVLKLQKYNPLTGARTVLVRNLKKDVTESQVESLFSEAGEVESVKLQNYNSALVQFKTDDGFCKAFLLNERELNHQPIFLEPHSFIKQRWIHKSKRDYQNAFGGSAGGPPNKFNKFGNGKPFNKRPAFQNGGPAQHFKKAKKF